MLASIWVTTACNMRCDYCYEGMDKSYEMMSRETVDIAIEYILSQYKQMADTTLIVQFHGGEPLMNFEIVKYTTNKIKEAFIGQDDVLLFGMTTNGTLLDAEKMSFLATNINYGLSISLDGCKDTHDLHRKLHNGKGSYDLVTSNALQLLTLRTDIRARLTFNSETVAELYENAVHLVKLGFGKVACIPDYYDNRWNEDHMKLLLEQARQVQIYLREAQKNHPDLDIILLNVPYFKLGVCTGGTGSFHILPNGDLYPCSYGIGDNEFRIGNVKDASPLDTDKLASILSSAEEINPDCKGCSLYAGCTCSRCKIINKVLTGNDLTPSPVVCAMENTKYQILKKNNTIYT